MSTSSTTGVACCERGPSSHKLGSVGVVGLRGSGYICCSGDEGIAGRKISSASGIALGSALKTGLRNRRGSVWCVTGAIVAPDMIGPVAARFKGFRRRRSGAVAGMLARNCGDSS